MDYCSIVYLSAWPTFDAQLNTLLAAENVLVASSKTDFCTLSGIALSATVTWPPTSDQLDDLDDLSPSWRHWYDAIVNFGTVQNSYNTTGAPARVLVGNNETLFWQNTTAKLSWSYNAKVNADSLVADAVTTKKEAEASLAAAQKAENAALAALMAVCPTFDPASV
jgi:hypothetical protein